MAQASDFPARGRITTLTDGVGTFAVTGTNYALDLAVPSDFTGPTNVLVDGMIHVTARKLYTVPSGGNFVSPVFGSPRTIQGRVKFADAKQIVIQAGVPVLVDLPADDSALDLHEGGIGVGTLVNVVAMPGAKFVLLGEAVGR